MNCHSSKTADLVLKISGVVEHCPLVGRRPYVVLHHVLLLRHVAVKLHITYVTYVNSKQYPNDHKED